MASSDGRSIRVTLTADVDDYINAINRAYEATKRLADLKKQIDEDEV